MVKKEKNINKVVSKKEDTDKKKNITKKTVKSTKKKEVSKDVTPKGFKAFGNELTKIKWPSKKDMIKYSVATVIFVIFFGIFFSIIIAIMGFLKTII